MVPYKDLKIITYIRNGLSVGIALLGITWLWATKQQHWLKDFIEPTLVVVGSLIALCQFLIQRWDGEKFNETKTTIQEDDYQKNYQKLKISLIEQYRTRLKSKLAFPMAINIGGKPTTYGTSEGYVNDYQLNKDLTIEFDNIESEVGKILKSHSRLLLIGEAGSGKTTILLFAALDLLTQDHNYQLPLMLHLATWKSDFEFEEWYERNVAESYNLSRAFAKTLILKQDILPFLDGFDEIGEDHRDTLFYKMRSYFGSDKANCFIFSSRKLAYQGTATDAPVYAQYEVKPLEIEQIRTALTINTQWRGSENALLNAINRNSHLQQAVLNPFYLNTASFLYDKGVSVALKAVNTEGVQRELVETFVARQVPDVQDRKYLWFLALGMKYNNVVTFELSDLQYVGAYFKWYSKISAFIIECFVRGWVFYAALFWYFLLDGFDEKNINVYTSPAILIPIFLLGFLIFKGYTQEISTTIFTKDLMSVSLFNVIKDIIVGAIFINLFLLSFALVVFLIKDVISSFFNDQKIDITNFYRAINNMFLPGEGISFFWALFVIIGTLNKNYINYLEIKSPYRRFYASMKLLHFSIIQHFHVRFILYNKGFLPFRLVDFFNKMVVQKLLETNGATWRFRHKILQDYFAEMTFDK
jgi:hypothetical protein